MSDVGTHRHGARANDHVSDGNEAITLADVFEVFRQHLKSILLLPLVMGCLALAATYAITPVFTATSTFLPPQQQQSSAIGLMQSLGNLGGLAGAAAGIKNPSDQFIGFLKSNAIQNALVEQFDLKERYDVKYLQRARERLLAKSKISAGKDGLINVEFDDSDPKFAAQVANGYVEQLGRLLNRLAITEAQQRRAFFEKQLHAAKDSLIKAEQTLSASGVSSAVLNSSPSLAMEGPARLRAQVTAQEVKLASMRAYLTPTAPEFRQAQAELNALRSQLVKAEQERPLGQPGGDDYIAKFREFKYQETLFELFARQYELARVDESREGASIQVVDIAATPELKSSPRRILIASAVAMLSGIALVVFIFVRRFIVFSGKGKDLAVEVIRQSH